jgi:hypothetical protein
MNLEDDASTSLSTSLRRAMRRESPAPGFASRVLQRIEADSTPRNDRAAFRRRTWRAVAASLTLTAVLGGWAAHTVHERRQADGERAREQVLLALRIAGQKVRYVQTEVRDIGSPD